MMKFRSSVAKESQWHYFKLPYQFFIRELIGPGSVCNEDDFDTTLYRNMLYAFIKCKNDITIKLNVRPPFCIEVSFNSQSIADKFFTQYFRCHPYKLYKMSDLDEKLEYQCKLNEFVNNYLFDFVNDLVSVSRNKIESKYTRIIFTIRFCFLRTRWLEFVS